LSIETGKRTPIDKLSNRNIATILAAAGYSFSVIAEAIKDQTGTEITRQQVGLDIAQVIEQHRPLAPDSPEEARILQIARLEMISNLAFQGFMESATSRSTTISEIDDGSKRTSRTRKRNAGDAKYLAIMQNIEVERSKILGVYAPERREERGELTVTFAWAESPQRAETPQIETAQDADYRLIEEDSE